MFPAGNNAGNSCTGTAWRRFTDASARRISGMAEANASTACGDVATPRRAVRHAPCCRVRVIQPTCEKPGRYAKPRQSLVMLRGAAFRIASAKALPPRDENSVCVIITNRLRLVSNTKSQTPRVIPCVDMRTLRRYKGRVPKVVQLATM